MLDENTGMRKRRRVGLGFRSKGLLQGNASLGDPELGGRRMQQLAQVWMQEHLFPWDQRDGGGGRSRRWVVVLAVLLLVLGSLGFLRWYWESAPVAVSPVKVDSRDANTIFQDTMPARFEAAGEVARAFLSANTTDGLLELVRERERVEPAVRAWYQNAPPYTEKIRSITGHGAANANGRVFVRMLAETEDFKGTVVSLEETAAGWKVDWESFVGWGEMTWPDLAVLKDSKVEPVLVRAWLSLADQYDPPFYTAGTHQACRLQSPDKSIRLHAWVPRDERALTLLRGALFDAKSDEVEVILGVRASRNRRAGELEITTILQTGWILWEGARPEGKAIYDRPLEK